MTDCALCQLAATPIAERPTKTFFQGPVDWFDRDGPAIEVVRDSALNESKDRLLAYCTRHAPTEDWWEAFNVGLLLGNALEDAANAEFGEGNWDFEVTMQSCPGHGWHCHARKRGDG